MCAFVTVFVHLYVCPSLSGSFPSTTKSGLGSSLVSREWRRAALHLSAGREMDGG